MDPRTKAALIKAVCAITSDRQTLDIAKWAEMTPGGRAAAHLDHYLQGSLANTDFPVDLARVLQEDGGVRFKVHTEVIISLKSGKASGSIAIPQTVYKNRDWQYAIGSMNINWSFPSAWGPDKVRIGFRNQYRWHPNEARITQCVHQAADRLKLRGARDYWMAGSADIVLSLAEWGQKTPRFHVVRAGDSLSNLALQYYRRADRWPEIHSANQDRLPDPNRLSIGLVLEIPELAPN